MSHHHTAHFRAGLELEEVSQFSTEAITKAKLFVESLKARHLAEQQQAYNTTCDRYSELLAEFTAMPDTDEGAKFGSGSEPITTKQQLADAQAKAFNRRYYGNPRGEAQFIYREASRP